MGKFLDRIKKFREQQKERQILGAAKRGFKREKAMKLKQIRLEEAVEKQVAKEQTLSKLREAQAKRIRFEQKILKAKASRRQQTKKIIRGAVRTPVTFRKIPVSQAPIIRKPMVQRPVGGVLLDRPKKKGKGTPGIGTSFRVL